jgi:hypothetical protein
VIISTEAKEKKKKGSCFLFNQPKIVSEKEKIDER